MLFNSFIFLVFLAVFLSLWIVLRRNITVRWVYLILASFFFYGWWDWRFLFLILLSGSIDFFACLGMLRYPLQRRALLSLSIIGNIGSLALFKYSGFLAETLESIGSYFGYALSIKADVPDLMLVVPIGISFYTFQSMSYTIDVYRGEIKPTRNILHFFAYLSLFPQLVAGPIVRARDFLGQLLENRKATETQRYDGLRLVVHGYFKKVVIADNLAPIVNNAFSAPNLETSSIYWWLIITMFAFQIYCDFSGYSDIARGLAKWMGFEFQLNFNRPYISKSLREFWTRWHISLSSWFKDYLYIPLGGSKFGVFKEYRNIWLTMLISGLWHGAAWTFVIWGGVHALFISIERISSWPERIKKIPGGSIIASLVILIQVWVAWLFFRAENLDQALFIIKQMFIFDSSLFEVIDKTLFLKAMAVLALAIARECYFKFNLNKLQIGSVKQRQYAEQLSLIIMMVASVYLRGPGSAFIYFQF